jgi:hypothetical protein
MTMFHVIHDRRGATAFEVTLILFPLFMIIFAIFDLSRYALTWYSVSNLADEAIRQQTICYSPLIAKKPLVISVTCPSDPLSTDQKKVAAPALFWGNPAPTVTVTTDPTDTTVSQPRIITAKVTGFKPVMSLIPYPSTLTVTVNLPF